MARRRAALGRGLAELLGGPTSGLEDAHVATGVPGTVTRGLDSADGSLSTLETSGPASDPAAIVAGAGVVELQVGDVRPNPRQPRRTFDSAALEELAASLAATGMVQPVIVRRVPDGFELIAGERRWRAAQMAGLTVVPAILRDASDTESLEIALVENVVRQQLNPIDEAYALHVLQEDLGVTQESLAARVGKSRPAIANKIRLLELPAEVQDLLAEGAFSEGHARALLGLPNRGDQLRLARRTARLGLSVRAVEAEVRRISGKDMERRRATAPLLAPELLDEVRDVVYGVLEVLPAVRLTANGGRLEIPFRDDEELRALLRRLSERSR